MNQGYYQLHLPIANDVYCVADHNFHTGDIFYVKGNKKCINHAHCVENYNTDCEGLVDTEFGLACFTFPVSNKMQNVLEWVCPFTSGKDAEPKAKEESEPFYRLIRLGE